MISNIAHWKLKDKFANWHQSTTHSRKHFAARTSSQGSRSTMSAVFRNLNDSCNLDWRGEGSGVHDIRFCDIGNIYIIIVLFPGPWKPRHQIILHNWWEWKPCNSFLARSLKMLRGRDSNSCWIFFRNSAGRRVNGGCERLCEFTRCFTSRMQSVSQCL